MNECALCLGAIEPLREGLNPCPHCGALAVAVSFDVDELVGVLEEEEA
jgi:hypothetical protein